MTLTLSVERQAQMSYPIPVLLLNRRMAYVTPQRIAWIDPGKKKHKLVMKGGKVFELTQESAERLMERINTIERQGRESR